MNPMQNAKLCRNITRTYFKFCVIFDIATYEEPDFALMQPFKAFIW